MTHPVGHTCRPVQPCRTASGRRQQVERDVGQRLRPAEALREALRAWWRAPLGDTRPARAGYCTRDVDVYSGLGGGVVVWVGE